MLLTKVNEPFLMRCAQSLAHGLKVSYGHQDCAAVESTW